MSKNICFDVHDKDEYDHLMSELYSMGFAWLSGCLIDYNVDIKGIIVGYYSNSTLFYITVNESSLDHYPASAVRNNSIKKILQKYVDKG